MQADWGLLTDNVDPSLVLRGVTAGEDKPNGGGNFVFGFNSIAAVAGNVSLYTAQTGFAPMAKGGSISAAVKRGVSGGPTNFAPFLYLGLQANNNNSKAYLLGLDDDDPHSIVLVKGTLLAGVPANAPPTNGVLAKGSETFLNNTWLHIRLDMIVNTNGDVILQMFRSDLGANPVTAPVWEPLPGAPQFIDDALGINSGSAPLTGGYGGFGFQTKDITRRGFFDQISIARQL